jgi:hypothetical protein
MKTRPSENEPKYYIQCLTHYATSIGGMAIQPQSSGKRNSPIEVGETFYKKNADEFDFYVDNKTISVIKPESAQYSKTAEQARLDNEAKKREVLGGNRPTPSMTIERSTMPNDDMAQAVAESLIKSPKELLGSDKVGELCVCKTAKGEQCKRERVNEKSVCAIHFKQILKGANIESIYSTIMDETLANDPNY